MFDASPNAQILIENHGKIWYLNQLTEKLFQYTRDELVGKDLSILIPLDRQPIHTKNIDSYFKSPLARMMAENMNPHGLKKDKTLFPLEITLNPIIIDDEKFAIASIIDISKIIKPFEEKRKTDEKFELLVESAPNAIILVNEEGKITLVNRQTEILLGYSREELINKNIELLLPDRFKMKHPHLMKMFFNNPQNRPMGAGRDLYAVRKDGSEFPIEIGLSPIKMPEGQIVLTSIIDITERKKNEEIQALQWKKIEDKNKELEQFTFIASHDLRAPLQSISSFTQLLIEENLESLDEDGKKSLFLIRNASKRMGNVINGLLDYGKIGKSSEIKKVDLNSLLNNVCEDLSFSIKASKAKIKYNNLPGLNVYETEIRLLFQNLIANAIKFRRHDVELQINITAHKQKNKWCFNISDNGIGIAQDNQEKIFILFQRLDEARKIEGSGIGLAHCKKIVDLHGGEIGVESELNKGSNFFFTINANLETN